MNDRAVSLLEQYELEVEGTRKGRDAILLNTDKGTLVFKEYGGNPDRLRVQECLLRTIAEKGLVETESLIPTKEGEWYVKDADGVCYIVKTWHDGRECNVREPEENFAAVRLLAKLHLSTQDGLSQSALPAKAEADEATEQDAMPKEPVPFSIAAEYGKRNRELKRIRRYLLSRSQKTWFEIALLGCFDRFYEQALEAQEGWEAYRDAAGDGRHASYCHGDYQYHNILFDQKKWYLINFERCVRDDPVRDLHLLMRKLLEKNNWSISLGEKLLREYERLRPLSVTSWIDLSYRLRYPEKFWKIANFYYNSGKSWIPEKNMEKLEKLMAREKEKKDFLESVFRI